MSECKVFVCLYTNKTRLVDSVWHGEFVNRKKDNIYISIYVCVCVCVYVCENEWDVRK